ncbi:hypothetical protein A8F94_13970 [Bacillus sp. FJAT-27225]|uniref:O-antigen ligase family protein n=1 Tax=Bacillus sp. FJAT-27225 TaxID=1743144 RepID=UPI00080C20DA|nr:O-antigen ligase family protein [Bacillus sp. FJAT-27225]OCA85950.1 hypothetical protein A8F94_13970 [Bacillus sp. FJAT-27225]
MYPLKNYLSKSILISLLSFLIGSMALTLTSLVNLAIQNMYAVIIVLMAGSAGLVILFLLKWEYLLFLFAFSTGFQLYDPSPYEIMFCLMIFLLLVKRIPFNRNMLNNTLFFMLVLFILFGTFSIFFAKDFQNAVSWHMITVYLVLSAIFLVCIIKNKKQMALFLKGYVFGAIANSLFGMIAYLIGKSQNGGSRLEAFFQDPNIFSPYIVIAILLVIEDSLSPKLFKSTFFKVFSIVLMLGALILAMSRAGWINFGFAIALYGVIKLLKGQLKPSFLITIIAIPFSVLVSVPYLFPDLTGQFMGLLKERTTLQSYDTERFDANLFTINVAENHPFGIGPGEITSIYYMDTHNTYLRLFAEYGWVASLSLLMVFLLLACILFKDTLLHDRKDFNLSLVLLCSLAGNLVNILVVDALHWRHFWVLIALCYYEAVYKKAFSSKGEIG